MEAAANQAGQDAADRACEHLIVKKEALKQKKAQEALMEDQRRLQESAEREIRSMQMVIDGAIKKRELASERDRQAHP